jgi:phenylalanyl-tRNA synthetase beta chain
MKISHSWLTQFIDIKITPQETSNILTDIGLEIEKLEKKEAITGGLKGIVIGEVLSTEKHPDADKLKLTKINIGTDTPLDIVCGAPNVAPNQKVIVATVGATLYPSEGDSFKIKKSKIRGEVSEGMLCAEDEIGLGKGHDGIMVLNENAVPGTPAGEFFNLEDDWIYEIGLTPNRADAMSHMGVARDLMVAFKHKGIANKESEICCPTVNEFKVDNTDLNIEIDIKNPEACPRYAGLTISELKVSQSPDWLKQRLLSIGLSPINNIVDATNYVLHELGQPLHAFDADKIKGDKVVVQTVPTKTKFTTLDEAERELNEEDLMICNSESPMCIAGVFGGLHSGVSETTTSIFLESAYFNPVSVRKTAKRHGLNTDASFRFERGIDPNITIYALKRAAMLIKEIAGGNISSEIKEFYPSPVKNQTVTFNYDRCNKLIGKEIPKEVVNSILESLEIKTLKENEGTLTLEVPAYRNDVTREADVVEEVLRIYGFNNIPLPQKLNTSIAYSDKIDKDKIKNTISDWLSSNGYSEMMSNSLTKSSYNTIIESNKLNPEHNVKMLNPLSKELDVLRQSLIFNGLEAISYNTNRQNSDLKLYEFGKTYHKYESGFEEKQVLTVFLTGKHNTENWDSSSDEVSLFNAKQSAENILIRLGIFKNYQVTETKNDCLEQGITYSINRKKVADIGIVKTKLTDAFSIKNNVYYIEINWDAVLELQVINRIKYTEIPKFPSSRRDLSLLIDKATKFEQIKTIAEKIDRKLLKEVGLFDIYEGKNLAPNKKSYAVSFLFRDGNKTIQDKQIEKIMSKIQAELEKQLGATLR